MIGFCSKDKQGGGESEKEAEYEFFFHVGVD